MPNPQDTYGAIRTFTRAASFAGNTLLIASGVATAVTAQLINVLGSFNGADGAAMFNGTLGVARTVSVTTAAHAGSYKTGASFPIVVTGVYGGTTVTENLVLTAANGGETIKGTKYFDKITSIAIPAENDALGGFTFGLQKIVAPGQSGSPTVFRAIKSSADGTLVLGYQGGFVDSLPCANGQREPVMPEYVDETTTVGVTVYV